MVPDDFKLGKSQRKFDSDVGRKLIAVLMDYLKTIPLVVQDGIQGEIGYKVGLRITTSIRNPHSAYIAWMGKLMIFPSERDINVHCWNYIIPEPLTLEYVQRILEIWPEYDPSQPMTLFDFTRVKNDTRRVFNIGVDYFGGAFKKPNLTMVWNKAESEGLISYHAGCTGDRVLKGLSGTGKTTLTVGPKLEQDDALLGLPLYDRNGKVGAVELIGLEAASFAKSEGLTEKSPEWTGLMRSNETDENGNRSLVLAMNIDCENVDYVIKDINGFSVKVPEAVKGKNPDRFLCTQYFKSKTTNGRFIFRFQDLNSKWGYNRLKILRTEGLAFKRFDMIEPIIRIIDPVMAVAVDSACESIITTAIADQKPGTRVRSYAATDFMLGEQADQALLKLKIYSDLGLGVKGKLVFFINNSGYVGEHDFLGNAIFVFKNNKPVPVIDSESGKPKKDFRNESIYLCQGEKITVEDSKKLVALVEDRKIDNWIINPVFGYLIPDPVELEKKHGLQDFRKRFNPLRYYSPEQIQAFAERDIKERSEFLRNLFSGQRNAQKLSKVMDYWKKIRMPSIEDIKEFYESLYGEPFESNIEDSDNNE